MEFDRDVWSDTTGKGNQLNLSSKLQNTVVNLLYDSSFENSILWSVYGSSSAMSYSIASSGYIGNKSLYIANSSGEAMRSSSFTADAGATYTFSGYVKTTAGKVQLGIVNANSSTDAVYSDAVSTNGAWIRVQVSYTNTSTAAKTMYAVFKGLVAATAYLDCVQAEKAPTASRYVLNQNGDFRFGNTGWQAMNLGSGDSVVTTSSAVPQLNSSAYKVVGDYTTMKYIKQRIMIHGGTGDSFVFSGWAKGNSASLANFEGETQKDFALKLTIGYMDDTSGHVYARFNPDVDEWQFTSGVLIAEKEYGAITLEGFWTSNANAVYFDGLQVFKEEYGTSYTYDSKGNVISVKDLQKQVTTYEYDTASNLTKILEDNKAKMTYTYDSYHNVKTAKTEEGHTYTFTYDTYGNNTKVSISDGSKTMSSSAAYTANGNLLSTTTDALGKVTTYSYNTNTGLLDWVKYPKDTDATKTTYSYDSMYRTASAAVTTDTGLSMSASYGYTDDMLTSITTPSTTYSFTYGNFALRTGVKIGSRNLATYSYTTGNNRLNKLTYGNSDYVQYTYDSQGRVTRKTFEDGAYESYAYDNNGNLATVTDSETGTVTTYYYDLINRQVGYREKSTTLDHSVSYVYNEDNNIASMTEVINGVSKTYSYTYDDDNRVTSMTVDGVTVNYTYDAFGRLQKHVSKQGESDIVTKHINYSGSNGTTSGQVSELAVVTNSYNNTFAYTYDSNGNIITYSTDGQTYSYKYDSADQLIQENDPVSNDTYTYTYDEAGNIRYQYEHLYTTETPGPVSDYTSYMYENSQWGDLLTTWAGQVITYDEIGNPLYDGRRSYTWDHGRQLTSLTTFGKTWTYSYDANGMRTRKTDGSVENTYTYVYNGSLLSAMTKGDDSLSFSYDLFGTPLTVCYNGTQYFYITNLQGDVTGICNANGERVVDYVYHVWGCPWNCSGTLANTLGAVNPLRFRSYIFDTETELYYLQSRYYNPEWGRFINADAYVATGQGFVGNNMFAYCGNSPVNNYDPSGNRYCSALTVSSESKYDRFISCGFQKLVMLEKHGKVVDMTEKLNGFMQENAEKLSDYVNENGVLAGWEYFLKNVNDYGELDIKRKENWKFETGKTYIYKGNVLRYDDPGNINFGYIGAVLFPEVVLCLGAGLNQIKNYGFQFGDIFSFYDDPRDNYMIKYGYRLYKGWY